MSALANLLDDELQKLGDEDFARRCQVVRSERLAKRLRREYPAQRRTMIAIDVFAFIGCVATYMATNSIRATIIAVAFGGALSAMKL